jgi:anti-anti-sigma factor
MTARVETATEDGSMHITLSGEIDLANAAAVEEEIHAAVSHQASAVSVDLTDLTYLASAGIRILFALTSRADRAGTHRAARLAHPPTHRALGL